MSLCTKINNFFKPQNFWSLYFRAMIESFMGVMIVTMSEIKLALTGKEVDPISLIFAFAMLISYLIFYCFVWSICFCVFIERHEAYRKVTCSEGLEVDKNGRNENNEDNEVQNQNDTDNKNNQKDSEEEPPFYEELLADLREEPFAVFHIPLVLTRILVFTFLIIMFDSFSKGTLPFLFLFLLSFQIYYLFQSIMAPKFEWWPLSNIYRINECFLLIFILVFSMMKSKEYYDQYTSASFIVILIFVNTSAVIFLQLCGNYIQGKKVYQEAKQYFANEPKIEITIVVKPKKKKKEIVYDVSTFKIEEMNPPEIEKNDLMIETVETIIVMPKKPENPTRFGLKAWEKKNGKSFIPNNRQRQIRKTEKHMPKEETKYPPQNKTQYFKKKKSNKINNKSIQEAWRNDNFAQLGSNKHETIQYNSGRFNKNDESFSSANKFNETFSQARPLRLTSTINDDDKT